MVHMYTVSYHAGKDLFRGLPTPAAADPIVTGPLGMPEDPRDRVVLFPNPTMDGRIAISGIGGSAALRTQRGAHGWWVRLPDAPGV